MKTTYKLILDKRRANNMGAYPIRLRVYQDQHYKDFTPNIFISQDYWNDSTQEVTADFSDYENLNTILDAHKSRLKKLLLLYELEEKPDPSLDEIITALGRNNNKGRAKKQASSSIIAYGRELAKRLEKAGKIGNSIIYTTAINKLKKYVKKEALPFEAIDYTFLDNWNATMLAEGLKINAVSNYMRTTHAGTTEHRTKTI